MRVYKFDSIYKEHIEALRSFALKLTKNKMDADDLVQETALKAFRNFNKYNSDKSFKNWSFTILKNTFITKYNARKKKSIISLPVEEIDYLTFSKPEADDAGEQNSKIRYLKQSIEKLSPKSKKPLKMYISGHSYKEISEHLIIPIGTVKSRINFARTKLKQQFKVS